MNNRCRHFWLVETEPSDGNHYCQAVCKFCGTKTQFLASLPVANFSYIPEFLEAPENIIKKPRKETVNYA